MEILYLLFLLTLGVHNINSVILRNNALMNKMVTQFQEKGSQASEEKKDPETVKAKLQSVLCHNFPSVPCNMILNDDSLTRLIEKSIQQMKIKEKNIETSTDYGKIFVAPAVNSEDISHFVQVEDTFDTKKNSNKVNGVSTNRFFNHDAHSKKKVSKTEVYSNSRNKIRKFYPHKIKYKDKKLNKESNDEDKASFSVEYPAANDQKRRYTYRNNDPAVWRIDYMKHGEPSINMFGFERDLKGKLMKQGPGIIVNDNYMQQSARKDVLHPDVYIKNNYVRKLPD